MQEQFVREYLGKFEPDNSYQGIYNRIRFVSKEEIAEEIAGHLEAQYFLEQRIDTLTEHIENLKKASQDYCVCGMRLGTDGSCGNRDHAPISEFDWYIKRNEL